MKEGAAMQHKDTHECAACNGALTVVEGKTAVVCVLRTTSTKFADEPSVNS